MNTDLRFGRLVLLVCGASVVGLVVLAVKTSFARWLDLALWWVIMGLLSVICQVTLNFGYIRLAPRFDALISYTMSIVAGPISLFRVLSRELHDLRQQVD